MRITRALALKHVRLFVCDGTENANSKMDKVIASNRLKIVPIRNGRERQTSEEQSDTHKMSELIPTYIFS